MTDLDDVKAAIPHREPFLFIDRIIERGEDSIVTEREVRADEPQFQGHYPDSPLMPGVLLCEACFQTGAILLASSDVMRTSRPHEATVDRHSRGRLPHWEKDGATYFVTWRLADSLPVKVREGIHLERKNIIETAKANGRELSASESRRLDALYSEKTEEYLNAGHGACYMNDIVVAECVSESLKHFDKQHYNLHSWVVMPNHVHVLFTPLHGHGLSEIMKSWKSFTAHECNKILGRTGTFWMEESFDRIVRDEREFQKYGKYIFENPGKARLRDWKWVGGRADETSTSHEVPTSHTPVLTRILEAKFRGMVVPGDVMRIEVSLDEKMGEAFVMSGKVKVNNKVVLRVKFIVAMIEMADK